MTFDYNDAVLDETYIHYRFGINHEINSIFVCTVDNIYTDEDMVTMCSTHCPISGEKGTHPLADYNAYLRSNHYVHAITLSLIKAEIKDQERLFQTLLEGGDFVNIFHLWCVERGLTITCLCKN